MEFRQVVHCVRSSAAAAVSRPSVLSTRLTPSGILLQHSHSFTTNSNQQSEAAAVAQPRSQPSPPPTGAQSPQHRVAQLRAAASQNQSSLPPRPPPIRQNMFDQEARNSRSWAVPPGRSAGQQPRPAFTPAAAGTTTTATPFPTGAGAPVSDPFNLPRQIDSDMRAATGGQLRTWDQEAFISTHYKPEAALRLRPSTGRTVNVKGQVDVARAFRNLQRMVAQNRVRGDEVQQRFHERPALKRKRQRRERWQARFKEGFRACIIRARELKAQGW